MENKGGAGNHSLAPEAENRPPKRAGKSGRRDPRNRAQPASLSSPGTAINLGAAHGR